MRKILLLLLLAMPILGIAKDKNQLSGNWKEVKRWNPSNKKVAYKDTIHMEFLPGNEYVWQKSGSFIYRGSYKIENGSLDIGRRYFTIVEMKKNRIILQDQVGKYQLEPYTPTNQQGAPRAKEVWGPVTSINQMTGHWSKFKSTSDRTLQEVDYTRLLKVVKIFDQPQGKKLGDVFAARDGDQAPSWYVESYNPKTQTLYCNGKSRRQFKVLKCEDNELIMEENGITYFFRQFRR